MTGLTPVAAKTMAAVLRRLGFVLIRRRGSHAFYRHPDGRSTVLAMHSAVDLGKGAIRGILKNIDISVEEFEGLRKTV